MRRVVLGYFSEIAINRNTYFNDDSWATHEQQLLWRCEDLQNRLEELKLQGLPYISSGCLTKDDLCYALPYCFGTIYDAEKALELAVSELKEKYGINLQPELCKDSSADNPTGTQLSFVIFLPPAISIAA